MWERYVVTNNFIEMDNTDIDIDILMSSLQTCNAYISRKKDIENIYRYNTLVKQSLQTIRK